MVGFKFKNPRSIETEKSDCTVRALSIATNVEYKIAHRHLANYGRKDAKSCKKRVVNRAYRNFYFEGNRLVQVYGQGRRKLKSVNWFLKNSKIPEIAIVRIRNHVFAVQHGCVVDTFMPNLNKKVLTVWKVYKI